MLSEEDEMFNIPILITTFKRLDSLDKIFHIIKKLNPQTVFISSDGAKYESDWIEINKVRDYINSLNLEGEIIKFYSNSNLGIFKNYEKSVSKVFETFDKLIFIEDDMSPTISYFYYCKFILEAYEDDQRIKMVNGHNLSLGQSNISEDNFYGFTKRLSSSANAFWKRSFEEVLKLKRNLDEEIETFTFENSISDKYTRHLRKSFRAQLKNKEIISFELLWQMLLLRGENLNVFPYYNLVKLGGVDSNSSNGFDNIKYLPNEIRRIYNIKAYEIEYSKLTKRIPVWDMSYDIEIMTILAEGDWFKSLVRRLDILTKLIINLRYKVLFYKVKRIINKLLRGIDKNG